MNNIEMMKKEYRRMEAVFKRYLPESVDVLNEYLICCCYVVFASTKRYSPSFICTMQDIFDRSEDEDYLVSICHGKEEIDTSSKDEFLKLFGEISKADMDSAARDADAFISDLNAFLCGIASENGDFTIEEANAVTAILKEIEEECTCFGVNVGERPFQVRRKTTPLNEESYSDDTDDDSSDDDDSADDDFNFKEITIDGNPAPPGAVTTKVLSKKPNVKGKYAVKIKFSKDYLMGLEITAEYTKEEIESGTLNIDFADNPHSEDRKCKTNTSDFSAYASSEHKEEDTAKAAKTVTKPDEVNAENMEGLLGELDGLVGMPDIKKDVHSLMNFIKVNKVREERGLKVATVSYHLVFTGNPGTGKTTVARLVAKLYHQMGILSRGQLVETDRSSLVGGYLGQTAIKTQEVIQSALGGVLFIDEAYSLANDNEDSYGKEAIETILKAMEDHRDELVVIVAGYTNLMHNFIESNPGLKSRFSKYFEFSDYDGPDMLKIFQRFCEQNGYELAESTDGLLLQKFNHMYENRDEHFGNARTVRNMFEKAINKQADRLADMNNVSNEELMTLNPEDIDFEMK